MITFIKKILSIFFVLLFLFFILPLLFFKNINKEKIENKITQTVNQIETAKENIIPAPTKILENGLPNKHLINMAFVPQSPEKNWDQPWQDACEEASLLIVDYFYKNQKEVSAEIAKDAILNMIKFEDTKNFTHDMNLDQMSLVGEQYLNYKSYIVEEPSIDILKKYISQDIPIIVTASGKALYLENRHFNSGGPYYHSLVILGYDDNKQQFIVHDVGTQFGSYFRYSYQLLVESIHDFPESGRKEDINDGKKRVLILLK